MSCGVHVITNTTEMIFNKNSFDTHNWIWDHKKMREHMKQCLETGLFKRFPKIQSKLEKDNYKESIYEVEVFCICSQPDLSERVYLPKRGFLTWIKCTNKNCERSFHNQCVGI